MRRANLCPQIRLRAVLQGSDEALHGVHAALSKMVTLLLPLLRMLEDGCGEVEDVVGALTRSTGFP